MAEIYSEREIALRCSLCGKLEHHTLSVFAFSGAHSQRIYCSCGFRNAVINMKDRHSVYIQVPCILCETEHVFSYPTRQFWSTGLEGLTCPESGAELGFFGVPEQLKEAVEQWAQRHAGGFEDYFRNPSVMFDMLNHLHNVAENQRLYCHCGSQEIEVDLYPDYLELRCSRCGDVSRIPAAGFADRDGLEAMDTVIMLDGRISSEGVPATPKLYRLK